MSGRQKKPAEKIRREDAVRAAFERACLLELEALKPGNVHAYADGHGMTVSDFRTSARVASGAIAQKGIRVGERISAAVAATLDAVKCNTNLGIVLLAAPLVHAALEESREPMSEAKFRAAIARVLKALTIEDAEDAFAAIRAANPAGLGKASRYDVNARAKVTLITAMRAAAKRDRIAYQYANSFADVFETGVPALREGLRRFHGMANAEEWATTGVYLAFLGRFPDSHILRKHGERAAEQVRKEAAEIAQGFAHADEPERMAWVLTAFDTELKTRGINPGTSADLTVATLLAASLLDIVAPRTAGRKGGLAP